MRARMPPLEPPGEPAERNNGAMPVSIDIRHTAVEAGSADSRSCPHREGRGADDAGEMACLPLLLLLLLAPISSRAALMHGPSFGTAHKGCWTPPSCGGPGASGCACKPFPQAVEVPVFNHTCAHEDGASSTICLMQHLWTGGSDTPFQLYGSYRVRYYVDGETTASVSIPVGMGTGEPYMDDTGPWSAGSAFGKTGNPSGTFNNFPVPFSKSINITVETFQGGKPGAPVRSFADPSDTPGATHAHHHPHPRSHLTRCRPTPAYLQTGGGFWIIVRGHSLFTSEQTDAAPTVQLPGSAGLMLPHTARLRTVENTAVPVAGGATMPLFKSTAPRGAVYLVVLRVDASGGPGFLEGCFRGMSSDGKDLKILLSSGTEDYFLGTYYFNKGGYENPVAGMTHKVTANCTDPSLGKQCTTFSAYRMHT